MRYEIKSLRETLCLGGKKLLHLDSWRCEASIKYQLRTEKQMDMEYLPRKRPASLSHASILYLKEETLFT